MGFFNWFNNKPSEPLVPGTNIPVKTAVKLYFQVAERMCNYDYVTMDQIGVVSDLAADGLLAIITEKEFDQLSITMGQLMCVPQDITDKIGHPPRADSAPIGDIGYGTREENVAKTKEILKKYEAHYK